ncbi:MAG: hypothetical protein LAT51_10795 [Flavobacteriaceae bacterium]|nr:hypothetical protein [Flavobacteriaceae bacterium]
MAKFPTFPTLYDAVSTLKISDLKKWGYLKPKQKRSGKLTWSRNGTETASISIEVDTMQLPYLILKYRSNEKPINYKINLVSTPSNLGIGKIWYFICPHTKKQCRKLYLISGYFLHRDAFNGCMYESQTKSKKSRMIEKSFGALFDVEKFHEELNSKNFKTHYNGKPTKRYLRLMEQIRKAESVPHEEFLLAMIS